MIAAWCSAVARAASPELRELFEATVDSLALQRDYATAHGTVRAKYLTRRDASGRMNFEDEDARADCFHEIRRTELALIERLQPTAERLRIATGLYESRHAVPGTKFFVTARRDDGAAVALAGPFTTHREALEAVPEARRLACERDPRGCWYSYGTAATNGGL